MKKLTKAQEKAINKITERLNHIKSLTFNEYLEEHKGIRFAFEGASEFEEKMFEDYQMALVNTTFVAGEEASITTLKKLEEYGIIKIMKQNSGKSNYKFHTIKLIKA